jgi:ABC-type transporter Mla subunit MlaD
MKLTDEQLHGWANVNKHPYTKTDITIQVDAVDQLASMAAELLTARSNYARLEEAYNEKQRCLMSTLEAHNRIAADLAQTVKALGEATQQANRALDEGLHHHTGDFGDRRIRPLALTSLYDAIDKLRAIAERG